MPNKTDKQSAGDLFDKIDWEGGFTEAVFSYGLDPEDYDLGTELDAEFAALKEELEPLLGRVESFMSKLEEVCDDSEES